LYREIAAEQIELSVLNVRSLSNAEGAEDQIQDVVIGCSSRNLVEGPQRVVKIEEQHFVGNFIFDG
jgi:hypothetical protein